MSSNMSVCSVCAEEDRQKESASTGGGGWGQETDSHVVL